MFISEQQRLETFLQAWSLTLERYSLTIDDVGELVITLLLLIIGFSASVTKPRTSSFVERDPSLSQPISINGDIVPSSLLVLYAVLFPALITSSLLTLQWIQTEKKERNKILKRSFWLAISFIQAFGVALSATNVLKNAIARQRPSFFAMINYAGYADAISTQPSSDQWAKYFAKTSSTDHESNYFGSLEKVGPNISEKIIDDAQRSFPSGHSSISFAGLTWLVCLLRLFGKVKSGDFFSLRAFISTLPLILAAYIAVSRVRDRKHNVDDISVGAVIGVLGAILSWSQLYSKDGRLESNSTAIDTLSTSSILRPTTSSVHSSTVTLGQGQGHKHKGQDEDGNSTIIVNSVSSSVNSEIGIQQVETVVSTTNTIPNSCMPTPERRQLISREGLTLTNEEDEEENTASSRRQWQTRGSSTFSIAPV